MNLLKNVYKFLWDFFISKNIVISVFLICVFTSCGYRWDVNEAVSSRELSVYIPYFIGDDNGLLTEIVITTLAKTHGFYYVSDESKASYRLEGKITQECFEDIGFQYDSDPISGDRINRLVPNEGRRSLSVEYSFIDILNSNTIFGPCIVSAHSDYDFINSDVLEDSSFINAVGNRESLLFFSLGQLDSIEGASSAASNPLYTLIAEKVIQRCLQKKSK